MAPIRTDLAWDPRKTLDLYPCTYNFMCVGACRTISNARCRWKISKECCIGADNILDAMEELDPKSEEIAEYLRQLARLLLCIEQHQKQSDEKIYEWSSKIRDVITQQKLVAKMQSKIQRLKEQLRECKQTTTNEHSDNKNQGIEIVRLNKELAGISEELDCERSAHESSETQCAALTTQTANLRAELTESQRLCNSKTADLIEAGRRQKALTKQNRATQNELERTQAKLVESNQAATQKDLIKKENIELQSQIAAHENELETRLESNVKLVSMIQTRDEKIAELELVLRKIDDHLEGPDETSDKGNGYKEDKDLNVEWNPLSGIQWPDCVEDQPRSILGIIQLKDQVLMLNNEKAALSQVAQKLITRLEGAELQIAGCYQQAALLRTHGIAFAICIILVASLLS